MQSWCGNYWILPSKFRSIFAVDFEIDRGELTFAPPYIVSLSKYVEIFNEILLANRNKTKSKYFKCFCSLIVTPIPLKPSLLRAKYTKKMIWFGFDLDFKKLLRILILIFFWFFQRFDLKIQILHVIWFGTDFTGFFLHGFDFNFK